MRGTLFLAFNWFLFCLNLVSDDQSLLGEIEGCAHYAILDEKERNYEFETLPFGPAWCDKPLKKNRKTNSKWQGERWYRFIPPSGTKIPEQPPSSHHCGTSVSGRIRGSHPTNLGEIVTRTVCFQSGSDICWNEQSLWTEIKVKNCGEFFLYYLVDVKACFLGYCAK